MTDTTPADLQAGPALDALIAERVMQWTRGPHVEGAPYSCRLAYEDCYGDCERFSTDPAAALAVVERMVGWDVVIRAPTTTYPRWNVRMTIFASPISVTAEADTFQLAVCKAALAALAAVEARP